MAELKSHITVPIYQEIALDIASMIVEGKYKVGEKIYARSSLASKYGVSSETARRAICVLVNLDIVKSEKGSGVTIQSYENAIKYVKRFDEVSTINDIKNNVLASAARQKKEMDYLNNCLNQLLLKTEHFRSVNPFVPFQIEITSEMLYLNKTIAEIKFWQNTSATIVAIKRSNGMMVSPGPYALLMEGDVFYYVGDSESDQRVHDYLYLSK